MTLTRSLPTQHALGLPLIDERRITAGRFARNADGSARVGVLPAHTNPLVTGRASMGYDIAAFNAVTARTAAGAEEIANDGAVTVTTTAAPASNSRIDVIWVRSQFVVLGDANNDVVFGVTQGNPGFPPSKPSIPAGALELATAEIPSAATTTLSSGVVITQTFLMTALAGGVVPFRSKVEMDAWTSRVVGQLAYCIAEAATFEYIGDVNSVNVGWLHLHGKPIYGAFTHPGGYAPGAPTPRSAEQGGRVFLEGRIISPSAAYSAGTFYFCGTIAASSAWPGEDRSFPCNVNDVFGVLRVRATDGVVTFTPSVSFNGPLQLNLNGISWPDKRLVA